MEYFYSFNKLDYVSRQKREGCIFCNILKNAHDGPDLLVLETERLALLLNLYPYNPGHSMLLPKKHITDIRELTQEDNLEMDALRDYTINALSSLYNPHGFNIGFNMGLPSGASIEHLHLHIIPRYPNEIGIAELIGGKRVLVEKPDDTCTRLREWVAHHPFSR